MVSVDQVRRPDKASFRNGKSLRQLGLSTLKARRERGDMIETYKILTGKFDVDQNICFTPLVLREGAASTRAISGHLNLKRTEAKQEIRNQQFSISGPWVDFPALPY